MKEKIAVILLLSLFFILVFTSVNTKSPICDEAGHHIAAGYSFLRTGDFRMNPSAPPLMRLLMGLPLLFLNLNIPTSNPSWVTINSTEFSRQFLFIGNKNADQIVLFARLPMIFVSVLLGFLVFLWAKKLYGSRGGFFALFLYVFSPLILANSGLAMLDMGCAFFVLLTMFQFSRYIKDNKLSNAALTGVYFGLALSAKHVSLSLFPVFLILAGVYIFQAKKYERRILTKEILMHLVLIWFIGFLILWGTYFFEYKPLLKNAPDIEEKIGYINKIGNKNLSTSILYFAKNVPVPLSTYMISFLGVAKSVTLGDQRLFFMGKEFLGGSRIYYIILFLIRSPLPFLLLLFLAITLFKKRVKIGILMNLFLLLPVAAIFTIASFSKLQGGIRYILPVFPFLFVWMGGLAANIAGKKVAGTIRLVFYGLCTWYLLSAFFIYPHYLAYFNELVGGPNGFAYKITADADWGQDFKELKRYIDKKGVRKIKLYCFGTVEPSYYGINYEGLSDKEFLVPSQGIYYAISSRYLADVKWTENMKPVDKVGYSIFIYYIPVKIQK